MSATNEVEKFWEFFKKFANDVGGRIPAAIIVVAALLGAMAYRKPEQAAKIAKDIQQYLFGMFFHPLIIQTYVQEQMRQHAEIKELKEQVANLRSVLHDVLIVLLKQQQPDEVVEEIRNVLKDR